jgi:hypothetical protein
MEEFHVTKRCAKDMLHEIYKKKWYYDFVKTLNEKEDKGDK